MLDRNVAHMVVFNTRGRFDLDAAGGDLAWDVSQMNPAALRDLDPQHAVFLALLIDFHEIVAVEEYFAADFDNFRMRAFQLMRHAFARAIE